MSASRPHAPDTAGVGLKWIALSATAGAAAMWLLLTRGALPEATAPTATVAASAVKSTPPTDAAPWSAAASAATATAAAAAVSAAAPVRSAGAPPRPPSIRRDDTALPSPELGPPLGDPADYALDDATLSRRARAQFGLDCPGIVERRSRRSGRFEVICTNGLRLRVNLMGDGPPAIVPIG